MVIKCDICSKEFLQNIQLKIHKRLHSDLMNIASVIAPEEAANLNLVKPVTDKVPPTELAQEPSPRIELEEPEKSNPVSGNSKDVVKKTLDTVATAAVAVANLPTSVAETSTSRITPETCRIGNLSSSAAEQSSSSQSIGSCPGKTKEQATGLKCVVKSTDTSENNISSSYNGRVPQIPPVKLPCPYPNCRLQVDEAELTRHLASQHNLHLCGTCGEVKNSVAALEEHRTSVKCRPIPNAGFFGQSPSNDSPAVPFPYNAENSLSHSKTTNKCSTSDSRSLKANERASTDPLSSNFTAGTPTSRVKRSRPAKISSNVTPPVVDEEFRKNARKAREESFRSSSSSQDSSHSPSEATNEGTCPECGLKLPNKKGTTIALHMQNDCPQRSKFATHDYRCDKCRQVFSRQASLRNHIKTCHNEAPTEHICEDCGEDFTTEAEKNSHWDKEHDKLKNNRGSPTRNRGRRRRMPSSDNSLEDDYPSAKKRVNFSEESAATESPPNATVEIKTPQTDQALQKGVTLSKDSSIISTTLTSSVPQPVSFPAAPVPVYHLPRPIKCNFCDSAFADRMDLAVHLLDHNAAKDVEKKENHSQQRSVPPVIGAIRPIAESKTDKLHKCVVCGGGFQNRFDMVAHLKAEHVKKGTYPCIVCRQVFSEAIELLNHTTDKHSDDTRAAPLATATINPPRPIGNSSNSQSDKKFPCVVCASNFDALPELNEHHRKNHPERPWFVCTQEGCHAPYATEKSLNRHLQKEHNLGPNRRR